MHAPICSPSAQCCTRWPRDLPFRGESSGVIFKAILDQAPTSAVRLNPDLPAELERIINKASGERPQSAVPARRRYADGPAAAEARHRFRA